MGSMAKITQIKPQKNNKRVNIYLDGKFAFGLDLENYMKLGLKVEQVLTDEEVKEIVKKAEFQKAYDKLLGFATLRPRSKFEIKMWFNRHKIHESLQDDLIKRLIKLELLDDNKFASWWAKQRNEFRPRSKRQLYSELRQKGIDKEIIDQVLQETKIDEEKIAADLLKKGEYKWEKLNKLTKRKKMNEYLARKGFDWGVIRRVVDDGLEN